MGKTVKRMLMLAAVLLVAVALAVSGGMLHANRLLRDTLDGRRVGEEQEQITHFSLREQMIQSQAETLVRGWLSVVQQEEISLTTQRGVLRASLYAPIGGKQDAPWALIFHGGLGTARDQVLDVACELSLSGYYVLTPDLHAHGTSDGTVASLGLADAKDVKAWAEWVVDRKADASIVLFGQDEGAAAVLLAAAEGLPPQVLAAAADSAYRSVKERALGLLESGNELNVLTISLGYRMRHGMDLREGELIRRIEACNLPLLLIHGTGDAQVPAWHSEDLAFAGKNAQLLFVEGAAHGMARYADAETYYGALLGFYEDVLSRASGYGR